MLPPKKRHVINIKNISSVEKDTHGLKPSNIDEKRKYIEKVSEKFLGQIKPLKHLLLKHHPKNHEVKKDESDFSPSSRGETLTNEADNEKNISHKKKEVK